MAKAGDIPKGWKKLIKEEPEAERPHFDNKDENKELFAQQLKENGIESYDENGVIMVCTSPKTFNDMVHKVKDLAKKYNYNSSYGVTISRDRVKNNSIEDQYNIV